MRTRTLLKFSQLGCKYSCYTNQTESNRIKIGPNKPEDWSNFRLIFFLFWFRQNTHRIKVGWIDILWILLVWFLDTFSHWKSLCSRRICHFILLTAAQCQCQCQFNILACKFYGNKEKPVNASLFSIGSIRLFLWLNWTTFFCKWQWHRHRHRHQRHMRCQSHIEKSTICLGPKYMQYSFVCMCQFSTWVVCRDLFIQFNRFDPLTHLLVSHTAKGCYSCHTKTICYYIISHAILCCAMVCFAQWWLLQVYFMVRFSNVCSHPWSFARIVQLVITMTIQSSCQAVRYVRRCQNFHTRIQ